ncbi:MAG TPA: hypothetical protein VNV15_01755 [Opitutaceae bacterium]|jgi:hypothetical protein|nr:hypothetical protein [Opitutaceae bacterium]
MHYSDSQIERIGIAQFVRCLYREKIKIAVPDIDDGIDLIAYVDRDASHFRAVPLQLKCYRQFGFITDKKYLPIHGLKIAYLWHVENERSPRVFLMDYRDAETIVDAHGWSRDKDGKYTRTKHTRPLEKALVPYECNAFRPVLFPNSANC